MQRIQFDRDRFRSLRLSRAWSLADLGRVTGLPVASLSRWERGKRNPNSGTIRQLATALGVDERELVATQPEGSEHT